jgi:Leucine-rich repeat (LRR) protein
MKRFSLMLALTTLLASLPASTEAQPSVLLPNELFWFTHGMRREPVDRKGLADLLVPNPKRDAAQPWLATTLIVGWHGFSDADIRDVVRMKKLTHLWICQSMETAKRGNVYLTAAGWSQLRQLPDLRVLGISDAALSEESFAEIGKLTKLTTLYLDCKGSNAGIDKLRNLKKLIHVSLCVNGAQPSDAHARAIAEFTDLQDLGIAHATISDAGVKELARLPNLRSLGIGSDNITDAGLLEVSAMKKMVAVNFPSPRVTQDGIDELWKARPDLLMINGAGMPPGPDSFWTMERDFYGPYSGMYSAADDKTMGELIGKYPTLRAVSIGWPGMSGAVMKDVIRLKRLTHLYVQQAIQSGPNGQRLEVKIDASGWKRLAVLDRLRCLVVSEQDVDADSLAAIGKLKELRTLRLPRSKATDAGLRHLANLKKLTGLDLAGTQLTDAGLQGLGQFNNLHFLSLSETRITDDGLKHLAGLPKLNVLYLDGTAVSNAGLKHLTQVKNLRVVSLLGTKVTDSGLKTLAQIKTLRSVHLGGEVTPQGRQWLTAARPDMNVGPR